MRKHNFIMGLLCSALLFTGCDGLFDGGLFKEELEKAIEYENAETVTVRVAPEENSGSSFPSGDASVKIKYENELTFEVSSSYCFKKWVVYSKATKKKLSSEEAAELVVFGNATSPSTTFTVLTSSSDILIVPECLARPKVDSKTPLYTANGVSKDRSISVFFNNELDPNSFIFTTNEMKELKEESEDIIFIYDEDGCSRSYQKSGRIFFKNISITVNGYSIAGNFCTPIVTGSKLVIDTLDTNRIEVESNGFKDIDVTISPLVKCVLEDGSKISIGGNGETWLYRINNVTDAQLKVNVAVDSEAGTAASSLSASYSMGNKFNLNCSMKDAYQFLYWKTDNDNVVLSDEKSITSGVSVISSGETTITAVCAPRLNFADVTPSSLSVNSRDLSVILNFNKPLAADQDLSSIRILCDEIQIQTINFKTPQISEDRKTITFPVNKDNLISVDSGKTKTVTVKVPSDFHYTDEEGYDVYTADGGLSYTYRIDDSTNDKTTISIVSSADYGEITGVSGNYSIGKKINIKFTPKSTAQFLYWDVTSAVENAVSVSSLTSTEITVTVLKLSDSVVIKPVASEKLSAAVTPASGVEVPRDSDIKITFNKAISSDNDLSKIQILYDAVAHQTDNYEEPELSESGKSVIFRANKSNLIDVEEGKTKYVTVVIPSDFYYEYGSYKVYSGGDGISSSFVINSTTEDKAVVLVTPASTSLGTTSSSSGSYSIGNVFEVSFKPLDSAKFIRWDITSSNENSISITPVSTGTTEQILRVTVLKKDTGINITPVAVQRPDLKTFAPEYKSEGVERDESIKIVLTRDVNVSSLLSGISILDSLGNDISSCYETPVYDAETYTVTIAPDYDNLIQIESGSTRDITVRIDGSVYYECENTRVNIGDSALQKKFRINKNTKGVVIVEADYVSEEDTALGTLSSPGASLCLGNSLTLRFIPSANAYFERWDITSDDEAVDVNSLVSYSDITGNTITLTAEQVGKVIIKPVVQKCIYVESLIPEYTSSGVKRDSTIEIHFSDEVEYSQFRFTQAEYAAITDKISSSEKSDEYGIYSYLNQNGDVVFKNISIENAQGLSMTEHFKKIEINDDKKSVIIRVNYDNLPDLSDATSVNLKVIVDKIKGKNTHEMNGTFTRTYKITTNVDCDSPVVSCFRAAVTKAEVESDDGNHLIGNNTFTISNLVSNKLSVFATASDGESGVYKIKAEIKRIKDVDAQSVSEEPVYVEYTSEAVINKTVNKCGEIEIPDTIEDGLLQINFTVCDYVGNESSAYVYQIIKDTTLSLEEARIYNRSPRQLSDFTPEKLQECVRTIYISNCSDKYYEGCETPYDELEYKAVWGSSKNNMPHSTSDFTFRTESKTGENEAYFTIPESEMNTHENTYFRITVTDKAGNSKNFDWLLAKDEAFEPGVMYRTSDSSSYYKLYGVDNKNIELTDNQRLIYFIYVFQNGQFLKKNLTIASQYGNFSYSVDSGTYEFYIQPVVVTNKQLNDTDNKIYSLVVANYQYNDGDDSYGYDRFGGEYTSSPLHFKYRDLCAAEYVSGSIRGPYKIDTANNNLIEESIPDVSISVEKGEISTSTYKLNFSFTKAENLNYSFIFYDSYGNLLGSTSSDTANVTYSDYSGVFDTLYYNVAVCDGSNIKYSGTKSLDVTTYADNVEYDTTPPKLIIEDYMPFKYRTENYIPFKIISEGASLKLDENDLAHYSYFWTDEKTYTKVSNMSNQEKLNYLRTTEYEEICLPYDPASSEEYPGRIYFTTMQYTGVCRYYYVLFTEDTNGNIGVSSSYAVYSDRETFSIATSKSNSKNVVMIGENVTLKYAHLELYNYYFNGTSWVEHYARYLGTQDENNYICATVGDYYNLNYFYKFCMYDSNGNGYGKRSHYFYMGSNSVSIKKASFTKSNANILSDAPVFVQTIYSPNDMNGDDDDWISLAACSTPSVSTGSVSYSVSSEVPEGFYYRYMVVFANNEMVLSDVYKK